MPFMAVSLEALTLPESQQRKKASIMLRLNLSVQLRSTNVRGLLQSSDKCCAEAEAIPQKKLFHNKQAFFDGLFSSEEAKFAVELFHETASEPLLSTRH
jgi:hypothetical protein